MVDMYSRVWPSHRNKQSLTLPVVPQVGDDADIKKQLLLPNTDHKNFTLCSVCVLDVLITGSLPALRKTCQLCPCVSFPVLSESGVNSCELTAAAQTLSHHESRF